MSRLKYYANDEEYSLDEFFKSLMFQRIMDGDFSRNERDVLLVVLRKTLHYDKTTDYIGSYWLARDVGIGQQTLRKTIRQLEAKGLLFVKYSKGGRTTSEKKFHEFGLSQYLFDLVFNKWCEIKESNNFTV